MAQVLIIDDDPDFVAMTKALLEANGYEVACAYNGEEGKAKVSSASPDAIILDVMMTTPTEGFEVARELRAKEDTKNIPLIMLTAVSRMTGFDFDPDEVWLPVDQFVKKPVMPADLLRVLKTVLEK